MTLKTTSSSARCACPGLGTSGWLRSRVAGNPRTRRWLRRPRRASGGEERQVGLALAAEQREVDLDAADAARLRQGDRLRLEALRREDAATCALRGVRADEPEIARQLLDGLDRADALDLDGDPRAVLVAAHEIDGADLRRPLAPHERQLPAQGGG